MWLANNIFRHSKKRQNKGDNDHENEIEWKVWNSRHRHKHEQIKEERDKRKRLFLHNLLILIWLRVDTYNKIGVICRFGNWCGRLRRLILIQSFDQLPILRSQVLNIAHAREIFWFLLELVRIFDKETRVIFSFLSNMERENDIKVFCW